MRLVGERECALTRLSRFYEVPGRTLIGRVIKEGRVLDMTDDGEEVGDLVGKQHDAIEFDEALGWAIRGIFPFGYPSPSQLL